MKRVLEVLKFIFEDFWRFLGVCVFLGIIALWRPVEVNIIHGLIEKEEDDG